MSNLVGEVHDHRSVEPRPIAIVFSVHLRGFVGVRKLKKSAVRTPDELKRTARNLVLNAPWEYPSQRLVAETQHRNHIRATADPAAIDPSVTLHLGISCRWHFATPFLTSKPDSLLHAAVAISGVRTSAAAARRCVVLDITICGHPNCRWL